MTTALEPVADERDQRRQLALLKAVGLDRAAPEQRELAIAIAKRYDLDLLLKHVVLIDGKPFLTRDALLWIAHRSGQFDGISVTRPVVEGDYFYAEATVYRKDMSHPFVYGGRYPVKGKNQAFGPEMAVKVAESMALRRAFNVSAPSQDERWDVDVPTPQPVAASLAERAAQRAQEVRESVMSPASIEDGSPRVVTTSSASGRALAASDGAATAAVTPGNPSSLGVAAAPNQDEAEAPAEVAAFCGADPSMNGNPLGFTKACSRLPGHKGPHASTEGSWPQ